MTQRQIQIKTTSNTHTHTGINSSRNGILLGHSLTSQHFLHSGHAFVSHLNERLANSKLLNNICKMKKDDALKNICAVKLLLIAKEQ